MEGKHASAKHVAPSSGTRRQVSAPPARRSSERTSVEPAVSGHYADEEQKTRSRPDEAQRTYAPERRAYAQSNAGSAQAQDEYIRSVPGPAKTTNRGRRILSYVIGDILLTGFILLVFAFFHHALPRAQAKGKVVEPKATASVKTDSAAQMPAPTPESETTVPDDPETEVQATPEVTDEPEVIDNRTEWQKKFEDKFTDEVVITDNSYSSPNISVTIETVKCQVNGHNQVYYVADIYVASLDCFKTYFAYDEYVYYGAEDALSMAQDTGAVLTLNGDYCNNQLYGILVRNGAVYYDEEMEFDLCALFSDGTIETYAPGTYDPQDIIDGGAWQTWKFGPMLLDENGKACTEFNTTDTIKDEPAPRSALGYYEPGHYCFVQNEGRSGESRGFVLSELAQLFEDLGCERAYNMDGGASSVLTFNGKIYNRQSADRDLGDILYIAEPAESED